jgi:DNA uptake protein ComE-like DNA-binding protein
VKHSILKTVLIALTLWTCAGPSLAAQQQQPQAKQPDSAKAQAPATKAKPATPRVEPVDINSAGRDELKKLPGIGDAEADKIIAGRPYLTKAHLVTHNVISPGLYQGLRERVVARQKNARFAKGAKK